YYIDEKEIEKIDRYGEGWLDTHPQREFILRRALRFKELIDTVEIDAKNEPVGKEVAERKVRLNDLRYEKIIEHIQNLSNKESIVDFGSGEGKLSVRLGFLNGVKEILAVEPSEVATLKALKRFEEVRDKENFLPPTTVMGSLFYYDDRLRSKDVMVLCEVIEHIDEYRLPRIMDNMLKNYRPKTLIITTPNQEYNCVYDMGKEYRHTDHRFEWTRVEFQDWCKIVNPGNYELTFDGIGEEHPLYGHPTQMVVFTRKESH